MSRRKTLETASLFLPVFLGGNRDISAGLPIPFDEISNGKCLYGDSSKTRGLRLAADWAVSHDMIVRVVEIKIRIQNATVYGSLRMDRAMFEQSGFDLLRVESVKASFRSEIGDLIIEQGLKLHPSIKKRSADEWLARDPTIGRAIFNEFPQAQTVIIGTRVSYGGDEILNVALLRSPQNIIECSVIHNPDIKVKIV